MTDTPPDWVLIEAAKRCGWVGDMAEWREQVKYGNTCFLALCDMIAKHEKPPADRKVLCAREAVRKACEDESSTVSWDEEDIACCAIELWEEGFGK